MKIRPLQDRIIVQRIEEDRDHQGWNHHPRLRKGKSPRRARLIAVGNGKVTEDGKLQPLDVKKGDRLLFSKYAGTEVTIDGEDHLIIREDDVLGILE